MRGVLMLILGAVILLNGPQESQSLSDPLNAIGTALVLIGLVLFACSSSKMFFWGSK